MNRHFIHITALLAVLAGICACGHRDPDTPSLTKEEQDRYITVNTFAYNMMNTYYLWNEEIEDSLATWQLDEDPVEKVQRIRYKDASGNDIDKWTQLTDDIDAMKSTTAGVSTTYGFDFKLYYTDSSRKNVCMVVTLAYPDSPAGKAGFKRGDVLVKIAGTAMTPDNYIDLVYNKFLYAPSCKLTDDSGKEYNLTAVEMYENPVLVRDVFEAGGKKVGYLLFNRFTLNAARDLIDACRYFRSEGIDGLILDMRYNPGGYVLTETLLASMLAPEAEVAAGSVFETTVYNKILAKAWGETQVCFSNIVDDEFGGGLAGTDISDANVGISHLYAILTEDSASASESVLVGLKPYLDVKIFGQQSRGKYCTGIMYSAKDWYSDYDDALNKSQRELGKKYADKWGIYIMVGRYADKYGNTPCMPDGFIPDFEVEDNPVEPYQLGDEREAMLSCVLSYLNGKGTAGGKATARRTAARKPLGDEIAFERDPIDYAHIQLLH